jgi:hypothetical protein
MRVKENSAIGKFRHPHRLGRSTYLDDGIFQRTHVVLLSHAWFFLTMYHEAFPIIILSRPKLFRLRVNKFQC